jgi:hypothetical protein
MVNGHGCTRDSALGRLVMIVTVVLDARVGKALGAARESDY